VFPTETAPRGFPPNPHPLIIGNVRDFFKKIER